MQGQPMNPPMMQPQLDVPMSGIAATGSMAIPTMLTQLAEEAGRGTDSLMGHLTAGELVVPVEVLDASPMLKKVLADTFADEGLELAQYIVGDELNMRNPTTGQPEFFIKKIFKGIKKVVKKVFNVAKKVAPFVLPFVAGPMLGAIGSGLGSISGLGAFGTTLANAANFAANTPWLSAGIGSVLGTKIAGGDTSDVLKAFAVGGIGGGITNKLKGGTFFGQTPATPVPPPVEIVPKPEQVVLPEGGVATTTDFGVALSSPAQTTTDFTDFFSNTEVVSPTTQITGVGDSFAFQTPLSSNVPQGLQIEKARTPVNVTEARGVNVADTRGVTNAVSGAEGVAKAAEIAEKGIVERGYEKLGLGAFDDTVLGKAGRFVARNPVISATGLGFATGAFTPEEYEPPSAYELQKAYAMMPNVYDYLAANPASQIDRAAMFADPIYSDAARLQPDYAAMAAGLRQGLMPKKANQGGFITGPGDERSDDIPAMLSDGEFVMTAKAVRGAGDGDRRKGAQRMYELMDQFQRRAS